jgi:hypothetical protein
MIARALRSVPDARAHPGAGSPGRRDRRPIGPPRRGHPPPARAHPRVRCPGRLEQRLSLLRRLADLANRARPGRRPPPGRPAHARGPAAPPEVPVDPVKVLVARNDADGLHLHARTAMPGWMGEYLDVGWAIGVLHPFGEEAYESGHPEEGGAADARRLRAAPRRPRPATRLARRTSRTGATWLFRPAASSMSALGCAFS